MKRVLVIVCLCGLSGVSASAANPQPVRQAVCTTPLPYPMDPTYRPMCTPQPYRWGWFGAAHYPSAPQMHRDYADGWREWNTLW